MGCYDAAIISFRSAFFRGSLSQWRGYANDATGVSIGFSKNYLEALSKYTNSIKKSGFTFNQVEYELSKQVNKVRPTFVEVKELIDKGAFKHTGLKGLLDPRNEQEVKKDDSVIHELYEKLSMTVISLFSELFLLKSNAFREEREWRLISYFEKTVEDKCLYRISNNKVIPYREYDLKKLESNSITEIILGPKNETPIYVIKNLMQGSGFTDVKISRSSASYR